MNARFSLFSFCFSVLTLCVCAEGSGSGPAEAWAAKETHGARLDLPNGLTFRPVVLDEIWKSHGATGSGGVFVMECGAGTSENASDGALRFAGKYEFAETGDGGVDARWSVVPDRDGVPKEVCIAVSIPKARCGEVRAEQRVVPIREGVPLDPHLFRGVTRSLEFLAIGGAEPWLRIDFPDGANVLVQDNQQWGKAFLAIRLDLAHDSVSAGVEYGLHAVFRTPGRAMLLSRSGAFRMAAGPDWLPYPAPPAGTDWIAPGSALDLSLSVPHHEPAGAFGRVVVVGDHFELEGRPGEPIRFCGPNIVHSANVPDPATVDRFAANLARMGCNTVRIHHHEAWMVSPRNAKPQGDGTGLDVPQESWDRFDALVDACVRHGLYITTDLFVSRSKTITWRALGIDRDGAIPARDFKALLAFYEPAFSNLVSWTREFLGHVNPYTGRSLAQEPALATLALVNEGNLGNDGVAMLARTPGFLEAWRAWLGKRGYPDADTAPVPTDVYDNDATRPEVDLLAVFLAEREQEIFDRLSAVVRDELGCKAPLSNLSSWYFPAQYLLPMSRFDYVDNHFYVDHPVFLAKNWRFPSSFAGGGENPIRMKFEIPAAAWRRVFGKPYCITEWNWSAPGRYRAAGGLVAGALSALQGWSGMWRFAWSHDRAGVEAPGSLPMRYFDLHADPVQAASERAVICLFLRGDLPALDPSAERCSTWSENELRSGAVGAPRLGAPIPGASPWRERIGVRLGTAADMPESPAGTASDAAAAPTAPFAAADATTGAFRVVTPLTSGGFAEEGEALECGALSFSLSGSPAALWASSLDGLPLPDSSRILLAHVTDARNTDAVFDGPDAKTWEKQGKTPALVRRGEADVSLSCTSPMRVWRLAPDGSRAASVPVDYDEAAGRLSFRADVAADPGCATLFYELER